MKEVEALEKAESTKGRAMVGERWRLASIAWRPSICGHRRGSALPRRSPRLAEARVLAAEKAHEALSKFYEEGKITLDRLAGMSKALLESQRDVAAKDEARLTAFVGPPRSNEGGQSS